jgi:hypothetical protein
MCFVCRDICKSVREGHSPFLLRFVRNCEIVVFKDMSPDH